MGIWDFPGGDPPTVRNVIKRNYLPIVVGGCGARRSKGRRSLVGVVAVTMVGVSSESSVAVKTESWNCLGVPLVAHT